MYKLEPKVYEFMARRMDSSEENMTIYFHFLKHLSRETLVKHYELVWSYFPETVAEYTSKDEKIMCMLLLSNIAVDLVDRPIQEDLAILNNQYRVGKLLTQKEADKVKDSIDNTAPAVVQPQAEPVLEVDPVVSQLKPSTDDMAAFMLKSIVYWVFFCVLIGTIYTIYTR